MQDIIPQTKRGARRVIFFTQIALLLLLAFLFWIGYADNGIETGSFFYAIILGALGASISLMQRIAKSDALIIAQITDDRIFAVLMPVLYGVLMTGIGYLLFMGEILSGDENRGLFSTNLFPNFTHYEGDGNLIREFLQIKPDGMINAAKLLVWSFIAGYSERFVTGILGQIESRGKGGSS